jgi:hypothetical protein
MSVTVGKDLMLAAGAMVSATRDTDGRSWRLAWWPNAIYDRNQVISGLLVADHVLATIDCKARESTRAGEWFGHGCDGNCPMWPFITSWVAELGPDMQASHAIESIEEYVRRHH